MVGCGAARAPLPLDARKIIARRAAMELPLGGGVNHGIGIPTHCSVSARLKFGLYDLY